MTNLYQLEENVKKYRLAKEEKKYKPLTMSEVVRLCEQEISRLSLLTPHQLADEGREYGRQWREIG